MIFIRKQNSKLFYQIKALGGEYTQHAEVDENCFLVWMWENKDLKKILFRACTVKFAKSWGAKDYGKNDKDFLEAIKQL